MRSKSNLRKGEAGQVLVYVTIIVALAALVMGPLLRFTYTGHHSARTREERMLELYAADAGIEDAMYQLKNEDEFEGMAGLGYGEDEVYYPGTPDSWNDRDMDVSISKVWIPESLGVPAPEGTTDKSDKLKMVGLYTFVEYAAAEDDFESDSWSGGEGWSGNWIHTGASIGSGAGAHQGGDYYLKFAESNGSAERATDLSGFYQPRLQFYANAGLFEAGDIAKCLVSTAETPVGGDWDTIITWESGNDTGVYEPINIDIAQYGNETHFWVAFEASLMSDTGTVAWEDFESGGWSGGGGWNGAWKDTGGSNEAVTSVGGPHSGNYHLRLRSSSGDVNREVLNLSNYNELRLQFYVKRTNNWESSDRMRLRVSSNELSWTTIKTWYRGDVGTSYQAADIDLSPYVSETTTWFRVRFDAGMSRTNEHFYVDDMDLIGEIGGHFYVDDLWLGNDINAYTIEIAYTDDVLGHTWLDTLGVWMPPGWQCDGLVTDEWDILPSASFEPASTPSFAGGTVLEWDFPWENVDLQQPLGPRPVVRSLTFLYIGGGDDEGVFTWLEAHNDSGDTYLSWDTGYEIYQAASQASHEIWGSNTQVEAYTAQGEIEKRGIVSYGNYIAAGSPLLVDDYGSSAIRETSIDGNDRSYASISSIPSDAEVIAAWLYWSAFQRFSSSPDSEVEFMYPKVYGPETFEVLNGKEVYTVAAYVSDSEPIVQEPRDVFVYLTPKRYINESLGVAYDDNGNETFTTDHKPILASPEPDVFLGVSPIYEGDDYTMDYDTGEVTIINEALAGNVYIDYSISELGELSKGIDYSVDYANGKITMTNVDLVGNATVHYWAQHWETGITHNAEDRYGTPLAPVVEDNEGNGWSYACFADATSEVTGPEGWTPIIEDYSVPTGNGEYAVRGVTVTQGTEGGPSWNYWCYSGWSLIVLYRSPSETAHQFFLYDPIHNSDCPFYAAEHSSTIFTLEDFYPLYDPDTHEVDGKITYFVGEGDYQYDYDYVQFKGGSEGEFEEPTSENTLSGTNNPWHNVLNNKSTIGEDGVDIDTFDISESVSGETEAQVRFKTGVDSWSLVYVILSFKTAMVPKDDYVFNVAAVTYSYELGTIQQ